MTTFSVNYDNDDDCVPKLIQLTVDERFSLIYMFMYVPVGRYHQIKQT